ncbi:hypothetical protein ACFSW8_11130 [Rubritalea tangerina]|uniref:Uncharacterized protein n=1 Tax=Rubritalea tangerina TaxID=430798 RepID=A0ABW4ZC41_9BACT
MPLLFFASICITGAVAAMRFGRLAASKGYSASKARRYPLLLLLAAMGAAVFLYLSSSLVGMYMPQFQGLMFSLYLVGNCFLIAVNLLILRKAYRNMLAAPDAGTKVVE